MRVPVSKAALADVRCPSGARAPASAMGAALWALVRGSASGPATTTLRGGGRRRAGLRASEPGEDGGRSRARSGRGEQRGWRAARGWEGCQWRRWEADAGVRHAGRKEPRPTKPCTGLSRGGEGRWAGKAGTIPSGDDPGPGEQPTGRRRRPKKGAAGTRPLARKWKGRMEGRPGGLGMMGSAHQGKTPGWTRLGRGTARRAPTQRRQNSPQAATAGGDGERPVRGRPQGTEKNGRAEAAHG